MPADDCGKAEIECEALEDLLRKLGLIPAGCKLDEGRRITGGGRGYVFKLEPINDKGTKKNKKR